MWCSWNILGSVFCIDAKYYFPFWKWNLWFRKFYIIRIISRRIINYAMIYKELIHFIKIGLHSLTHMFPVLLVKITYTTNIWYIMFFDFFSFFLLRWVYKYKNNRVLVVVCRVDFNVLRILFFCLPIYVYVN